MRKGSVIAPILLAACSTAPAGIPIHGVTPGHKCELAGTDQFVGKQGTKATGSAIKRVSHAAVLRWSPPGVMLTMDYRQDRVTVWLDSARKITQIKCG
ncbi:MAG TPA: I78 family peptidase inhibitor [Sphingomicrobium sp.]|nr:I78 family peptidase inhibitor [Sphingomicrobium sp.]